MAHIVSTFLKYNASATEVVALENAWRQNIHKSQLVSLYLILGNKLPLDIVREILKHLKLPMMRYVVTENEKEYEVVCSQL